MQKIKEALSSGSNKDQTTPSSGSGVTQNVEQDIKGYSNSGTGYSNTGTGYSNTGTGATSATTGTHAGSERLSSVGPNTGRAEEGLEGSRRVSGSTGPFSGTHALGHDSSSTTKFDPSAATTHHDHKHLNHVTQRDVRHVEVEEVQREKEHERNIHHVQHHVQPVMDKQENEEIHHKNAVPITKIHEQHVNTQEDHQLFNGLATKHHDTETHRGKERTVVDMGERVTENVHHHVHHVTQPVVQQEVVDRHRIHTVIPTHHVTHEAPIIHKSSIHEPVHMSDFLSGGGKLGSGITHENAGVLQTGDCDRKVEGVGEKLAQELNLRSGTMSNQHAGDTKI